MRALLLKLLTILHRLCAVDVDFAIEGLGYAFKLKLKLGQVTSSNWRGFGNIILRGVRDEVHDERIPQLNWLFLLRSDFNLLLFLVLTPLQRLNLIRLVLILLLLL